MKNEKKKQQNFIILTIISSFVAIAALIFILKANSKPIIVNTTEVSSKLLKSIIEVFDFNNVRGLSIVCKNAICDRLQTEESSEDLQGQTYASESWKLSAYSAAKKANYSGLDKNIIDSRINDLSKHIIEVTNGSTLSDQTFVLAENYLATGDLASLKQFIYLLAEYSDGIKNNNWDPLLDNGWVASMSLARIAQQLSMFVYFLKNNDFEKVYDSKLWGIDKARLETLKEILKSKDEFITKLPFAIDKYIKRANVYTVNPESIVISESVPVSYKSTSVNAEACWILYAYTESFKYTKEDIFHSATVKLLQESNLANLNLSDLTLNHLQGYLPCLASWKNLIASDAKYTDIYQKFTQQVLDAYYDAEPRPQCLKTGVLLSSVENLYGKLSGDCYKGESRISDVAWLYYLMSSENFNLELNPL